MAHYYLREAEFCLVDFNDAAGEDFDISVLMFQIVIYFKVSVFYKDKKNDILIQLELVPFKFYSSFIFFTTVSDKNKFAV